MSVLDRLPQDVLEDILLSLPDFNTLSAALRASKKHFLNPFSTRPKSTVWAIAYNVAGPSLPYAARLAFYESTGAFIDEDAVTKRPLHRNVCEVIQRNATVVAKLEDVFSQRYKDRTSPTSRLTSTESFRFCRALYRAWLWHARTVKDRSGSICEPLLQNIPTNELLEMERAVNFVNQVSYWTVVAFTHYPADPQPEHDPGMMCPLNVIRNYEKGLDAGGIIYDVHGIGPFALHLDKTLQKRAMSDEAHSSELAKAILDEVHGSQDTCHRCYGAHGVNLWGRSNWHRLRDVFSVAQLARTMDGNLSRNSHEMRQFDAHITARDRTQAQIEIEDEDDMTEEAWETYAPLAFDWCQFLEELCDMDTDAEGPWDKTEWYCTDCIRALFRLRLRLWWVATKTREGLPFKPDCWYGYACRTQVHRPQHAAKLNHLCVPTRGDGVVTQPH